MSYFHDHFKHECKSNTQCALTVVRSISTQSPLCPSVSSQCALRGADSCCSDWLCILRNLAHLYRWQMDRIRREACRCRCTSGSRPSWRKVGPILSFVRFVSMLTRRCLSGLTVHHTIEERHFFPILAKRMPMFQDNDVHLKSHEAIHHGMMFFISHPTGTSAGGC